MSTKLLASTVIALAAFSGVSAFAQVDSDRSTQSPMGVTSNTSRMQVKADFVQERQASKLMGVSETATATPEANAPSTVTRAEVRAQAIEFAKTHNGSDINDTSY